MSSPFDPAVAGAEYAYLTTTGRTSGRPRRIEIWFVQRDGVVYLLCGAGDRAQWVRNIRADPAVRLSIGPAEGPGRARVLDERDAEDAAARAAIAAKYRPRYSGDLSSWERRALVVAIAAA
jgi:deazaflavin-dependent oxidoreductase (nitroreductase family)